MSDKQEKTVKNQTKSASSRKNVWSRTGIITIVAAVLFVSVFGYGYSRLAQVNTVLLKMVTELQAQASTRQHELVGVEQTLSGLQSGAQRSQELSAKQEQMIAGWQAAQRGDLSRWYVAEAQYLTKLAKYNLQLTQNSKMAVVLLEHAHEVLSQVNDPALTDIRKALERNLSNLKAAPQVNVDQLYMKMATIYNQLDNLPLPVTPLQPDTSNDQANKKKYEDAPWYKMQWHKTMRALRKIVIVRYNSNNELPLVLPEEKVFLYQNLHAQMETAMWSALNRNNTVFQASVGHMISWIERYFVLGSPVTTGVLQQLRSLQTVSLQAPSTNIVGTIQLFDLYLGAQKEQTQTNVVR